MHASPLTIAVGCFAAGSLAAVGIANAVSAPQKIPDSSTGVITACYQKSGGNVRFINAQKGKTCKSGEKKVTFNQQGPKGAQGVQGERGPSNGYFAKDESQVNLNNLIPITPDPTRNTVVAINLPAGSYTVNASTRVKKSNNTTDSVTCVLSASDGTLSTTSVTEGFDPAGSDYYHTFAATGAYTNAVAGTVYFKCTPSGTGLFDGRATSGGATVTATQVATLTAS